MKHSLEQQTARPFKIEVWTDSSSAKVIVQRLGLRRRAKHLEVPTLWVQQLEKIGLISLNKLDTLENVADVLTKHVPRAVLDKLAGIMGYTFLGEESVMFQTYTSISQNDGGQKLQQSRNSLCSKMKKMTSWRMTFAAVWKKRLISRQPF